LLLELNFNKSLLRIFDLYLF